MSTHQNDENAARAAEKLISAPHLRTDLYRLLDEMEDAAIELSDASLAFQDARLRLDGAMRAAKPEPSEIARLSIRAKEAGDRLEAAKAKATALRASFDALVADKRASAEDHN